MIKQVINEIKENLSETYKNKVTNVDIESIEKNVDNPGILLYLFPLIEKTFVEILKFNPVASVEVETQGSYRTMYALLNDPTSMIIFKGAPPNLIDFLKEVYKEDGIRNQILHHNKIYYKIEVIGELIKALHELILIFNKASNLDLDKCVNKIEYFE